MSELRVGVVIPAYNAAPTLARALRSVLDQDPPPEEVIVVDDGSGDETAIVAREFGDVVYLRQSNLGPSAARNRGWSQLKTEAVVFLDADDFLLRGGLSVRRNLLTGGETLWAYTEGFLEDGSGSRWHFSASYPPGGQEGGGRLLPDLLCRNFIGTSGTIVRRDVLEFVGGFDESTRWMEDWDLWLRLAVRHPVRFSSTPTFVQRLGPNTLSSDREAMIRMRYRVLVKFQRLFPREVSTAGARARRSVADAHNWFGYAFAETGRWRQARPYLWTSVRLWPAQRRAWWLLLRSFAAPQDPAGPERPSHHRPAPSAPPPTMGAIEE